MNDAAPPSTSTLGDVDDRSMRELLSRLADGDCDGIVTPQACRHWRDDSAARASWHEYHLIGDLLRSHELHRSPNDDAAFLNALRQRMAGEPPIVAPLPAAVAVRQRPVALRWVAPTVAVAGAVAVVGWLAVTRATDPAQPAAPQLAASRGAPVPAVADAAMMRDARIDLYLQAHQGMRMNAAAAMPGGGLRNVDVLVQGH